MSRLTLDLAPEIDNRLTEISQGIGITKAEAMRRAFALLAVAYDEKKKGNGSSLGIVRETEDHSLNAVGKIVGLV